MRQNSNSTNSASDAGTRPEMAPPDNPEAASSDSGPRHFGGYYDAINLDTPLQQGFLPSLPVTLFFFDFLFMYGSIAGFLFAISDRLGFSTLLATGSVAIIIVIMSMIMAYGTGCYRKDLFTDFSTATTRLAVGLGVSVLLLVPLMHFGLAFEFDELAFRSFSRNVTIALIAVGVGLCGGMVSRAILWGMIQRHWFQRTILVIGTGRRARHLRDILAGAHHRLTQVYFLTESDLGETPFTDIPGKKIDAIAGLPSARELAIKLHVDQVVLAVDDPTELNLDHLLPLKTKGIPIVDFNTFLERETDRVDINWTEPSWLLYTDGFRFGHFDRAMKRLMDLGISVCLLLITLPALMIVACFIVLEDFGPVFYTQQRVSEGGHRFWILKFRTMRLDAEKNGAQWASKKDPRVTKVGRILRRTRIDEIPQLFNVLKGDMSLVGPRPERPVFVDDLSKRIRFYHLRHSVKAGVTGWAQINYDYGATLEDAIRKLEYDIYYLKHFSVLRDITIMLQTVRILLFAKGGR